jgi:hypothetical protein
MRPTTRDGLVSGVVLGLVVAFVFALVIRYVPAHWLLDPLPRAILYAVQVPAGLLFVPIASAVARARAESPRQVLLWACCGALAFDGLVLGFWPSLYGHEGAAQAMVATLLLWAFAWIVAAAMLATRNRAAAAS